MQCHLRPGSFFLPDQAAFKRAIIRNKIKNMSKLTPPTFVAKKPDAVGSKVTEPDSKAVVSSSSGKDISQEAVPLMKNFEVSYTDLTGCIRSIAIDLASSIVYLGQRQGGLPKEQLQNYIDALEVAEQAILNPFCSENLSKLRALIDKPSLNIGVKHRLQLLEGIAYIGMGWLLTMCTAVAIVPPVFLVGCCIVAALSLGRGVYLLSHEDFSSTPRVYLSKLAQALECNPAPASLGPS